jgi:hypothetical protein
MTERAFTLPLFWPETLMPDYRIYLISNGQIEAGFDYTFEPTRRPASPKYAGDLHGDQSLAWYQTA